MEILWKTPMLSQNRTKIHQKRHLRITMLVKVKKSLKKICMGRNHSTHLWLRNRVRGRLNHLWHRNRAQCVIMRAVPVMYLFLQNYKSLREKMNFFELSWCVKKLESLDNVKEGLSLDRVEMAHQLENDLSLQL